MAGDCMTEPLDIDADTWHAEVHQSSTPVLVDFWHQACVWCKHLDPVYSQLAGEFSDKLKFAKLNVLSNEKNNQLATQFAGDGDTDGDPILQRQANRKSRGLPTKRDAEKRNPTHD